MSYTLWQWSLSKRIPCPLIPQLSSTSAWAFVNSPHYTACRYTSWSIPWACGRTFPCWGRWVCARRTSCGLWRFLRTISSRRLILRRLRSPQRFSPDPWNARSSPRGWTHCGLWTFADTIRCFLMIPTVSPLSMSFLWTLPLTWSPSAHILPS